MYDDQAGDLLGHGVEDGLDGLGVEDGHGVAALAPPRPPAVLKQSAGCTAPLSLQPYTVLVASAEKGATSGQRSDTPDTGPSRNPPSSLS